MAQLTIIFFVLVYSQVHRPAEPEDRKNISAERLDNYDEYDDGKNDGWNDA